MKSIIYILLSFLIFPTILTAQQLDLDRRQVYIQAENAYQIGHIDDAINVLESKISSFDGTLKVSAYRLLALCYLANDEINKADQCVDLLLAEDPYYSISLQDPVRFSELIRKKREGIATLVTASQQAETLDEAPVPVTLITEDMIKAIGARDLRDVLTAYVPGITLIEGEEANISMRGVYSSSQEDVLIMLNGHRLNSHCTNSVAPDFRISLDNIKQIEVLRGAASSLYGNVALTAVVNIITKRGGDVNGLEATYGMGSNNTYKGSLLLGKSSMNTDILLWASIYTSRGYKHIIDKDNEDFYGLIPKDGYLYVDGYNHKPAYDLGLTYQWNKFKVSLSHQYSKRVSAYNNIYVLSTYDYDKYGTINGITPGRSNTFTSGNIQYRTSFKDTEIEASFFIDYETITGYNVLGDTLSEGFTNLGGLFYPENEYIKDSIHVNRGVFQIQNYKDLTMGGSLKAFRKYIWGQSYGNVLFGVNYEHFNMFDNDFSLGDNFGRMILTVANERNNTFFNGVENSFSFFAQAKHYLNSHLIFNGGLRYDFKNRYNKKKMNVLSPRLSLIYLPTADWNIKLSYSRSFVDAPYFYRVSSLVYPGRESLNPQYMNNLQLSSSINIKPLHLEYDFNLYYNNLSDIIFLAVDKYTNSGKLNMLGWENGLTYRGSNFHLLGNFAYQYVLDAKNYSATNNKIHAVPNFMLHVIAEKSLYPFIKKIWINAQISCYTKRLSPISNTYIYKGNTDKYINTDLELPGYCLMDLGMRYSWNFFNFNLRCSNILNKKYRLGGDRVPLLQAGRSVLATISFKLN
ncbi:TonB-dependent receptor [uncultured Parabacteroides sp.]|uniref:TonB-dependent receptor plug domain-containing protein n=1 Tax=uncultured Parabacteroides sp. TaxID=512312 RepID=UPI002595ED28|nr:TonB-dependent receptor [uncultured Parabacteroides sp.]